MKKQLFIIVFSIFITGQVFAQAPVANFSIEQSGHCTPVSVSFINHSTGDNLTYYWDLGNGNQSNLENPQAIYTQAGSYTIQLIVSNSDGSDTLRIENGVTAHINPNIEFDNNNMYTGCVPFQANYQLSNIIENTSYQWDFGNGQIYHGNSVNPNFDIPGNYNVLITAVTDNGCMSSAYYEEVAEAYPNPHFDIIADETVFCSEAPEVHFSLNGDDNFTSAHWSFGDGDESNNFNPTHIYNEFGEFDVSCTVTNEYSCVSAKSIENMIEISPVIADFEPGDTLLCTSTVSFQNLSTAFQHAEWNFGDNATSYEVNPQHHYENAGSYQVTLKVWNNEGCVDSITKHIQVDPVVADFTVSNNSFCQLPAFISYASQCTNAVSWEYHMGNGDVYYEENPTHIITEDFMNSTSAGAVFYTDTLIVTSPLGCTDMMIQANNIEVNQAQAYFTPNNLPAHARFIKGCAPFTVNFHESSMYQNPDDEIISYAWDFGDGNTSTQRHPSHTWEEIGEYEVSMTITTALGCENTYRAIVEVGSMQVPNFTFDIQDTVCASEYVQFMDNSSDQNFIDQWLWSFSDGGVSMSPNPSYHFTDTGYMDVSLVVGHNGCMSEPFTVTEALFVDGPVAEFTYDYDCSEPLSYQFYGELTRAESWYWDMGDGFIGFENMTEVSYEFAEAGNYQVRLVANNESNGCEYIYRRTIKPRGAVSHIEADTTYGCRGLIVNFSGEESIFTMPTEYNDVWGKYHWVIEGEMDTVVNEPFSYQFNHAGNFEVQLITKDRNGCTDIATQNIRIFGAEGNITSDVTTGCSPLNVQFGSEIQSDTTIVGFEWHFGDGVNSQDFDPTHIYSNSGNFEPQLIITDELGCETILELNDMIVSIQPSADFSVSDRTLCVGDHVVFDPDHNNLGSTYYWTLGNGVDSEEQYPENTYNESGYYDVSLQVIDTNNCQNQLTKQAFISVDDYPTANFVTTDTASVCYPYEVNFENLSSDNVSGWDWSFGDETSGSTSANPTHNYVYPGLFDVSLIVSSPNGCTDSMSIAEYIEVGGPAADIVSPESACKNANVEFYLENMQNIYSATWDMGNGQFLEGASVEYAFSQAGSYTPVLLLESDNQGTCSKAFELDITIPEVSASIISAPHHVCQEESIEFTNNSHGATEYTWSFTDGSTSHDENPIYQFNQTGVEITQLIAALPLYEGMVCTDTMQVSTVVYPKPSSAFSYEILNPHACITPKEVHFVNESHGAQTYLWNFQNGRPGPYTSDDTNPNFTYQQAGDYGVSLVSINQYNCSDTASQSLRILPEIQADFNLSTRSGCEPLDISFSNESTINTEYDALDTYQFILNDSILMTENSNQHTLNHGKYSVDLIVKSAGGCIDTISKNDVITVFQTPKAEFVSTNNNDVNNPEGYGEVQFENRSEVNTEIYTVDWSFGDGYTSNEKNPMHRYNSNSEYYGEAFQASLSITDSNGCSDTITKSIHVNYFNGLYVPNALAPDRGIGEQTVFMPKGKSLSSYHLMIFNVNGELIFESSALDPIDGSPVDAWDGKINGNFADEGVYVWKIEAEFSDGSTWNYETKTGKKANTGTLLVIR